MKNLTVIIPVIELNEDDKKLFLEAVESIGDGAEDILVVGEQKALDTLPKLENKKVKTLVNNTGNSTYSAQVNFAVGKINTKYFSVLEFDDRYTKIWFKNVEKYMKDDFFAYLPLTTVYDDSIKREVGFFNEAWWATSFSEEIGCLDSASLQDYFNFNVSGAIIDKDEFIKLGMLKPSMKLVFWYEFLLRALYKGKKIFVIPKNGYIHRINRAGSLSDDYSKNMKDKEAEWWIDLAKKELYFPNDRNKVWEE